jgi:N-acetylmuramoyl-L-alanine amidase
MVPIPDTSKTFAAQAPLVLLAMLVFGESRSEPFQAQIGVANVACNRMRAGTFGQGIAEVALRPFQFSCFLKDDPNYEKLMDPLAHEPAKIWTDCYHAASYAWMKQTVDPTRGAIFYHDSSLKSAPHAWGEVERTAVIGRLSFYRLVLRNLNLKAA